MMKDDVGREIDRTSAQPRHFLRRSNFKEGGSDGEQFVGQSQLAPKKQRSILVVQKKNSQRSTQQRLSAVA